MKKFLMITQSFPPFGGGGVQRMVKFATYLKKQGWEATVVCPNQRNDSWLDFERLDEIKNIETIRIGYRNLKDDCTLIRIIRKLYPVDAYFGWALRVVKTLKKRDLSDYDVILTSSPPHSIHLVGLILSRYYNLKWVADFRDHFTLNPEYRAYGIKRIIDKEFERIVYKKATVVILNTATNKKEIIEHLRGIDENKIHVIYNGFDYSDLQESGISLDWGKDNLKHYLYLGGLRGDRIDGAFYRTLATAFNIHPNLRNELKIHIIGDHSRKGESIQNLGIADVFEFSDPVSFNHVGDYLKTADACLTWQTSQPRYRGTIAGKFFDYIGMKKPVFSLGPDDGEIAKILTEYQIGISVNPSDIELAANKFIEFHQKIKNNLFTYSNVDSSLVDKFNRVEQSKQLANILNYRMELK